MYKLYYHIKFGTQSSLSVQLTQNKKNIVVLINYYTFFYLFIFCFFKKTSSYRYTYL